MLWYLYLMWSHRDQVLENRLISAVRHKRWQALAVRLRAPPAPQVAPPADLLILGVTPTDKAPPAPDKVPGTDNLNTITK